MAYEKQNFVDGNVLTADNLNHMEEGIAAAAPAGFGLGTTAKEILDANTAVTNGWYKLTSVNVADAHIPFQYVMIHVTAYDARYVVQDLYRTDGNATHFRRAKYGDTWGEWVNMDTLFARADTAVRVSGDTMTGSLRINGSWKGVSFGENAAILNAGTRLTFDQRPQNSTGAYERYVFPTPTERTADAWYDILTTRNIGDISATASVSNSYHTAHFAKIGKLVICTVLPAAYRESPVYESQLTIPSGYRPASGHNDFVFTSKINKTAGGTGIAVVQANSNGYLNIFDSYGYHVEESCGTYCWLTA